MASLSKPAGRVSRGFFLRIFWTAPNEKTDAKIEKKFVKKVLPSFADMNVPIITVDVLMPFP